MTKTNTAEMTTTQLYRQFKPMVMGRVFKYARQYEQDHEELQGRAHLIFMEAVHSQDNSRGSFSTNLYQKLRKLETQSARAKKKGNRYLSLARPIATSADGKELTLMDTTPVEEHSFANMQILDYVKKTLRGDTLLLAHAIIAKECAPPNPKKTRQQLRLDAWKIYVRKTKALGWNLKRTQNAWNGLCIAMSEYIARDFRDATGI